MFSSMMIRFKTLAVLGIASAVIILPAKLSAAPKPVPLGAFKDWAAFTYKTAKSRVCYIISQPVSSAPKGANRDPIFFIVTHRPGDRVRNEVNTIIGYPFKNGSTASLTIDNASKFKFFTSGDGAWAGSKKADSKIVGAMRAGSAMIIKGRSGRGTRTTDKYSLAGVSAALDKIDETCRK